MYKYMYVCVSVCVHVRAYECVCGVFANPVIVAIATVWHKILTVENFADQGW